MTDNVSSKPQTGGTPILAEANPYIVVANISGNAYAMSWIDKEIHSSPDKSRRIAIQR